MEANRWYMLRHPEGFDDGMLARFSIRCDMFAANLLGHSAHWKILGLASMPTPEYQFEGPVRSDDGKTVTLSLGGEPCYGALKLFEDEYPELLRNAFPTWFILDLEYGRRDTLGWFPQAQWWRVIPEDEATKLRDTPMFQKPVSDL